MQGQKEACAWHSDARQEGWMGQHQSRESVREGGGVASSLHKPVLKTRPELLSCRSLLSLAPRKGQFTVNFHVPAPRRLLLGVQILAVPCPRPELAVPSNGRGSWRQLSPLGEVHVYLRVEGHSCSVSRLGPAFLYSLPSYLLCRPASHLSPPLTLLPCV